MILNTKAANTVIITPEIVGPDKNGGIGTFVYHFSKLLRQHDYKVSIIYMGEPRVPIEKWGHIYQENDIPVIIPTIEKPTYTSLGYWWYVQKSEAAAKAIPEDTDVIYTQDWHANGFWFARARRYQAKPLPVLINVFNSSSAWIRETMQSFPDHVYDQLTLDFAERYTAQHSDYVISPSRYMMDWVQKNGWKLPPPECQRVLGYPFLPEEKLHKQPVAHAPKFARLVFFGRLETRKGLELFIDTLRYLKSQQHPALSSLKEIVFLGREGFHRFGTIASIVETLQAELELDITVLDSFDTHQAQAYLADSAADTLVVMPSHAETMGFTVIEASLIPGLNLICSGRGGMAEVLGEGGKDQLLEPYLRPFARKLVEWLERGPRPDHELAKYNWRERNQGWLDFHQEVCERALRVKALPASVPALSQSGSLVDVCIPYYNHPQYLPQTLKALEYQTVDNFNVIVVNDGSDDPESIEVFQNLAKQYAHKGWKFVSSDQNMGLSEARNFAARLGTSKYLLFVDSDNVPMPQMVERFVTAIENSGDDCLTCYMPTFEGDDFPYSLHEDKNGSQVKLLANIRYVYMPLGNSPETGIFFNTFGDANFIIRREVFDALNGFSNDQPHYRYIVGEDQEMLTKMSLQGYKIDIIAEFLFLYRYRPDSLLRTTNHYENLKRYLDVYQTHLEETGLRHLVPVIYGLHQSRIHTNDTGILKYIDTYHDPGWVAEHIPITVLYKSLLNKLTKYVRMPFRRRTQQEDQSPQ